MSLCALRKLGFGLVLASLWLGCSAHRPSAYASGQPGLELEKFFDGSATAVGTLSNRSGTVIRRFRVRAQSSWSEEEQALTVDETWYWDDGEVEPRNWRWEKLSGRLWRGLEDDLTGPATGEVSGNTIHWRYTMGVETTRYGRLNISADDVMHLVDENNIVNLVDMYYFGIYVGQVVLHIEKGDERPIEPWPAPRTAGVVTSR